VDDVSVGFVELVALTRITADSTVEKFGSLISSSFFDASNILATLKQKGLVDFVTAFPSQSTLKVTDKGNELLAEVNKRATEPIDQLDIAILTNLSNGKRGLADLTGTLNVAQKDLAVHIYKLSAQQNLTYELVNANVSMFLTEKGFVAVKNAVPQQVAATGSVTATNGQAEAQPNGTPPSKNVEDEIKVLEEIARKRRANRKVILIGIAVAMVIVVAVIFLVKFNYVMI
jgi:DNA-binding MarR family transcriptional regulator